jgi:hypothetical protein
MAGTSRNQCWFLCRCGWLAYAAVILSKRIHDIDRVLYLEFLRAIITRHSAFMRALVVLL